MPKLKVIDLSHYNSIPESLAGAAEQGVRGIIHKCTEGTSSADSKAAARYALTKDAGMLWGLYHFIRPEGITDQVAWFLYNAGAYMNEATLLACDWEDVGVYPAEVSEFMRQVESFTKRKPVLYGGSVIKHYSGRLGDLSDYRLWLAQYAEAPELPQEWEDYFLWQYSDGQSGADPHRVDGVNSPCDCNDFQGSDDDLAMLWEGKILKRRQEK
jgi:lysozyme